MAATQGRRIAILQAAQQFYTHLWRENRVLLGRVVLFYREFVVLAPQKALSPQGRRARQLGGAMALSKYESLCLVLPPGMDKKRGEDFGPPAARVALLPLPDLRHMAALTGVTLLRDEILRAVARHEVQALRAAVGEETYCFALTKAATYQGHVQRVLQEMQRPEVLPPPWAAQWNRLPLPQRVLTLGWWCLGACMAAGGPELTVRMTVLLPEMQAQMQAQMQPEILHQEAEQTVWPLVRVLIFKEIPCQWEGGWPSFFA